MANIWVSSAARGGDDGTDYDNAYGTIEQAWAELEATGSAGDIVKVVNDGAYVTPTSITQITSAFAGTDYDTDPGFRVEGVAVPAVTDDNAATTVPELVTFTSTAAAASALFLSIRTGVNFIDIKGLKFDMSPMLSTGAAILSKQRDAAGGPVRWTDCHFVGDADDDADMMKGLRRLWDFTSAAPADWGEVRYCIFENCGGPFESGGNTTQKQRIHHSLFKIKGEHADTFNSQVFYGPLSNAGNIAGFYNNTIYIDVVDAMAFPIDIGPTSGDCGTADLHSNVFWIETSVGASKLPGFFGGASGSTAEPSAGTIGFNILYTGPSVASGDVFNALYEEPWDDPTPKATDVVAYETADTVLFYAPATPLEWVGSGGGYTLTVPEDLRLLLHLTSGLGSTVPGAFGAAQTDRSVTHTSDRSSPEPEETVVFTITAANSGTVDTNTQVAALLPSGLTYVSHTVTVGTYSSSTGVWAIGTFLDGASEILVVTATVDADQGGNTLAYVATISGDLTDPSSGNDAATATLEVVDTGDVGDPGGDGVIPVIDTFPLYTTDLRFNLNMWLRTKMNRKTLAYLRKDVEGRRWREMLTRHLVVATSTTVSINLGGIQRAKYLMVDSDVAVQVGVGTGTTKLYPASKGVVLAVTDFELLDIKNPSATDEATILLVVTD